MKATGLNTFMARVDAAEYGLCRKLNRGASFAIPASGVQDREPPGRRDPLVRADSAAARSLRRPAVKPALVMALTGALGVATYWLLKRVFVRERPFITHAAIDLAAAPLDRYSFPSGPHAARGIVCLAGDGALSGARLGAAAACGADRRLARGARPALPVGRARWSGDRRGAGRARPRAQLIV